MGKCDKQCELVFHMTGGRHRTDCAAYEPELSEESRRLLFEEGKEWEPFLKDGTEHGQDHSVFAPHVLVNSPMESIAADFLDAAKEQGKKGVIFRMQMADGSKVRVMLTRE